MTRRRWKSAVELFGKLRYLIGGICFLAVFAFWLVAISILQEALATL